MTRSGAVECAEQQKYKRASYQRVRHPSIVKKKNPDDERDASTSGAGKKVSFPTHVIHRVYTDLNA
jgi:hypothetical protein